MKRLLLFVFASVLCISANSQIYFVTNYKNTPQVYGGAAEGSTYAGFQVYENFNLLAAVLGDVPDNLLRAHQVLVAKTSVAVDGKRVVIQPFAYTQFGKPRKYDLPIGNKLSNFLLNPLGVEKFDLTLPFTDSRVALSDRSALLRIHNDDDSIEYHTSIDFDRSDNTREIFDVIAPADGIAYNGEGKGTFVILHKTPLGKEFLTVYQHLDPASKRGYKDGDSIKRGQKIGVTKPNNNNYNHLHFGVAVKGPASVVDGQAITGQWFLIDPFGVYDIRRERFSNTNYNYLPNNNIDSTVRGIHKAFVFITNPISGSFFYPNEDCTTFNPNLLTVNKLSNGEYQLSSEGTNIERFRNIQDAGKAMQIIKLNGYTRMCFATRSSLQFKYYK